MGYRDDREALHNRVAQLESELEQARREGEEKGRTEADGRVAVLEKRVREMRVELARIERELADLRGGASPSMPRRTKLALGAGAISVLALGLGFVFVARSSASRTVATVEPLSPPPMATPEAPVRPEAPTAKPTAPPAPRGVARTARPLWMAKVTRAEGVSLDHGGACRVEATIRTTDTDATVSDLGVYCGTLKLYRSTDALSGVSQSSSSVREILGPTDDKGTFMLAYQDIGTRTGARAQIDLDTSQGQAVVFRETIPRFRVELTVSPESIPGQPLSGFDFRLRRSGEVTATRGAAPVKTGATCVLRAMATGEQASCTAEVACGAAVLWPKSAPASCTYEQSRPVTVAAEGLAFEDPMLTVTRAGFEATLTLDPP